MSDQDFKEVDISDDVIKEVTGEEVTDKDSDSSKKDNTDNKDNTVEFCYICHRPSNVVGPLIKLAPGMSVCPECMQHTFDSMSGLGFGGGDNSKSNVDMNKIPNISFLNLGSLFNEGPKVKNAHGAAGSKSEEDRPAPAIDINNIIPPHKIKGMLDEYVVGQDYAKKVMSVAVYNHYKRVATGTMDDIEIEKSNMLMLGPTGSGKTYLVRTLARLLDVPLAITDATSLTEAGYIGDDIESVVSKLLAAAGNDVERCQQGIIFIDEIDKLAKKKNTNQRDVSGESVQQGMLKLLEGADVEVPVGASSKNAMVPTTTINTKNILFICGGAFPAMDEIIKARLNKHSSMGFMADLKDKYDDDKNILQKVTVEDLREFGMIPEFIGRLPVVFATESLDDDMLVRILKEPKNAIIKQYQKLLELDEVKLEFEDEALYAIAKKAKEKGLGARGLRSIIEEFMLDIMYEIPKDENIGQVIITADYIEKKGGPRILMRTAAALPEKTASM
ncbi:MAG: ATP-dependent Clp protease ATP-binding subunit ClpX [Pseudobutyrivibrio sp.]|nr:ATP-dependent Clp protease ATP-binding subunit ClpX [Pseudobutyrivibrio sp.]